MHSADKLGFPELAHRSGRVVFFCSGFCFVLLFIVNLFYAMIVSTSLCQRQNLQVPFLAFVVIALAS
jgi:hypothetical protein